MTHEENAVSKNLREIRKDRNLSLDQLSELTGVSKSMLRQIETGRSSPTISTIWKIATGLRISFTTLVNKRRPEVALIDYKESKPLTAQSGHYRLFPLIPFGPESALEIYHIEIDPGTSYAVKPHEGNVEEYVFVNQGTLEITVEEVAHRVEADQCIHFAANHPHQYRSAGEKMVSAILMIRYLG